MKKIILLLILLVIPVICFCQPKSDGILFLKDYRNIKLGLSYRKIKELYGQPFYLSAPHMNVREVHYTCLDALDVKRRLILYFDASEKLTGKELVGPDYGTIMKIGKNEAPYDKTKSAVDEVALINVDKANIRNRPGINSRIITIAERNEPVIIYTKTQQKYKVISEQKDYWYNVERDKNKTAGWVFGANIKLYGKPKKVGQKSKKTDEYFEKLNTSSFNKKVKKIAKKRGVWTNYAILVALKYVGESIECKDRIIEIHSNPEPFDTAEIIITDQGIMDDSIKGYKHKLQLKKHTDSVWMIENALRAWNCWRGHKEFSTELCP